MGLPNCSRSFVNASAASNAAWASPTPHAAMPKRPESSDASAIRKPVPSSPSRRETGTWQSSNDNAHVGDDRHPILSSFLEPRNPAVPFWTRNALIPFADASPVRAMTRTRSASAPRVQKTFAPFNRYPSADASAFVISAAASDPEDGSESEYAPNHSPSASGSSSSLRWASVPNSFTANAHKGWTESPIASAG